MTDLHKILQQALEALELGHAAVHAEAQQYHAAMAGYRPERHAQMDAEVQQIAQAITALRAALAQPEPCPNCASLEAQNNELDRKLAELGQAEPVQEPVAWMVYTEGGTSAYVTDNPNDLKECQSAYALYPGPFERKPLTEEEIFAIENDIPDDVVSDRHWTIWYARAVERAHNIKE